MPHFPLGGDWSLADGDGAPVGACPIPGDIHSALLALGRILDPHAGMNEAAVQWVGESIWEIGRQVEIPASALEGGWAVLELEFLDTIATLFVNDTEVAKLDSSFIRHRLDVTAHLREGENEIRIRFLPPIAEASARAAKLPFPIPWAHSNNRVPDLNMIRKAQSHGGWDWGPCLLVAGIYAEPVLHIYEGARIEHVTIRQHHHAYDEESEERSDVTAIATVELAGRDDGEVPVRLELCGAVAEGVVSIREGKGAVALSVDVGTPELWWPAGYGEQPLHEAVVTIPGDEVRRRLGFRHLRWDQTKDEAGSAMTLLVNGRAVFCKGANWIPADALPSRITPERIRALLSAAVEANMNMIRVWGGGFYEFDAFYDACDERGLLVWQDMMFSCAQYPSTPDFLAAIDAELRYQVKRLASRPSIAIWCGDNEVIGSLTWYDLSRNNRDRYLVNYDRLNRAIEKAVTESDPDRLFWPSSPCNGGLDYGDAWHDDGAGDMHFWDVWHANKNFEHYYTVKPRFCSEFGFQSFPTMNAIRAFAEPQDWNATAPVMEFHQRDQAGNSRIIDTMARYFRMPTGFEEFIYLSQLQQAFAIETAVRYWRSLKPHSMGALYWQLNDVWPCVSWSSIDHTLSWKTLHHHARRFFAPVALAARAENGTVTISGVNDGKPIVWLVLRLRTVGLDGSLIEEEEHRVNVPLHAAVEFAAVPVPGGLDRFLVIDARDETEEEWNPTLQIVVFGDRFKRFDVPDAAISLEDDGPGRFRLSSDKPAFFVLPEAPGFAGHFDDASFLLLPGEPRTVTFKAEPGALLPELADLRAHHLGWSYR